MRLLLQVFVQFFFATIVFSSIHAASLTAESKDSSVADLSSYSRSESRALKIDIPADNKNSTVQKPNKKDKFEYPSPAPEDSNRTLFYFAREDEAIPDCQYQQPQPDSRCSPSK